jgi:UDP-GlcNAc:undecaprenyl-phosphate GlcNAc-1-phosphate transferase
MVLPAILLFPILSFVLVLAAVPAARRLAAHFGFVDKPGGRKEHDQPTPPIGGLLIVPLFILVSILSGADAGIEWPFWTSLTVIMVIGALDDRYVIRPRWKFLTQFIAAGLIVVPGGATIVSLGNVLGFGTFWLGFMAVPFSVIAVVLLINAINLIDGLDGLAGGKSFVALFWMLVAALLAERGDFSLSIAILMGTLAAFLVFNMRHPFRDRASIFLGDAGSMALGLALAWYGLKLGRAGAIEPIAVAWVLALPIMDTCAQFARRVKQGRHPFDADRDHFHHHVLDAGIDVGRATALIIGIGFVLGLIGVGGTVAGVSEPVLGWLWIAAILTHMGLSMKPERMKRIVFALAGWARP